MSSTIEIIPFQPGHIVLLDMSGTDSTWIQDPVSQFAKQANAGLAYTMLINGRVAAVGGVSRLWPGLGEAWVVPSQLARRHPLALTKAVIRGTAYIMQSLHLNRLQAHVKTSDKRAIKWAESIGFVREGTLRKYGADGSDHEIYAIVR